MPRELGRRPRSGLGNVTTAAVVAGAVAALLFANSLVNGFTYDDNRIIVANPAIQDLGTLPAALAEPYWPGSYGPSLDLWRPVVTAVFGLQWALWGPSPFGFHVFNVLLHAGVTALVVLLLAALLPLGGAFVGGLIFAVHPVHVEAVSNVAGMSELLAAFFFLMACQVVLRGDERLGLGSTWLALVFYALAFLSKEGAVVLPAVVFLLDGARKDVSWKNPGDYLAARGFLYGGMLMVAGLILLARVWVLGSVVEPIPPLGAELLAEVPRIWTVAATWPHLLRLLVFPMQLSMDYGPRVIPVLLGWGAWNLLGVALILVLLGLSLWSWRRPPLQPGRSSGRALGFGVLWFLITFLPASNVLFLSGVILAERTLYLPSVGFAALAGWGLLRLWGRSRPVAVVGSVLILSLLAARSWIRTPTWESNQTAFGTLALQRPEAGRSHWFLADSYFKEGRLKEAMAEYRRALGIVGGNYNFRVDLGQRLIEIGHLEAAALILRTAWEDRPRYGAAPGLLASIYEVQGRYSEAETAARASLSEDPGRPGTLLILSRALLGQGKAVEALEAGRAALVGRQGSGRGEVWSWLAGVHMALGDSASARAAGDSARAAASSTAERLQVERNILELGLSGAEGGGDG